MNMCGFIAYNAHKWVNAGYEAHMYKCYVELVIVYIL